MINYLDVRVLIARGGDESLPATGFGDDHLLGRGFRRDRGLAAKRPVRDRSRR